MERSLFAGGSRKLSPPSADMHDLTIRYSVAREARGTAYGITSLERPKVNNTTKIPLKDLYGFHLSKGIGIVTSLLY